MRFYLDASVLVPLLIDEAATENIERFVIANAANLVVSDFAAGEVAAAVSRAVRKRELADDVADVLLADFDSWRSTVPTTVHIQSSDVAAADSFVRQYTLKLLLPDAVHVACCRRLGLTLVTSDLRLAAAAPALDVEITALD